MKILALLLLSSCSALGFAADIPQLDRSHQPYDGQFVVGFLCDKSSQQIQLGYFDGHGLLENSMDLWDTHDLKENRDDVEVVKSIREVERTCVIGKDRYVITIRGVPGNWRLNGECGGVTYAGAKVVKNRRVVFDEDFQICRSQSVIARVTFSTGSDLPVLKRVTPKELSGID